MKINWKKILMFGLGACGLIAGLVLSYVNLTDAAFYTLFFSLFFVNAMILAFVEDKKND